MERFLHPVEVRHVWTVKVVQKLQHLPWCRLRVNGI